MIVSPSHGEKIAGNGYDVIPPNYIYPPEKQKTQPSYGSIDESVNKLKIPLAPDYGIEKKSQRWLSQNHETPMDSTPYIQPLLENLKKYKDDHFADPFSSFISALYDALVFNNSWVNLKKEQFALLIEIMIPLNNNPKLDYDKIDKAINKLEKLGLDSTPF
jgi:hypothetical protein